MSVKQLWSFKFLLFIVLLLTSCRLLAVEVTNLYTGKVLVTDKTLKTRVKAHRWAIEQVFTKVTGTRDILKDKTIQRVVRSKTANYIKSFAFITDEQGRTFLVDEFDQAKIDKLLRDVSASIWGQRRPQTLVWLVVEEGLRRQIISSVNNPQLAELVIQSADDRGLPLLLPKLDQQDTASVFSSDIWARFEEPVSAATKRYQTPNYVMARMYFEENANTPELASGWKLQYQLMADTDILYSSEQTGDQFVVLKEMINDLTDYFASQYAIKSATLTTDNLQIGIYYVKNVIDLVKAERLLEGLPPVSQVSLNSLHQQQAQFTLTLSGEPLDVIKSLALLSEFNERVMVETASEQPNLSNEERLDNLAEEYIHQNDNNQPFSAEEDNQIFSLQYDWVGK